MKRFLLLLLVLCCFEGAALAQESYRVEKVAEGVYAAIALPGGRASSNAFFVEGDDFVVVGGAHLGRDAMTSLFQEVAKVTAKPVRYFVLAHHHRGFSGFDFDYPPGVEVLMSVQTWQALDSEVRSIGFPILFFSEGLTLKSGEKTIILTNLGRGHTAGDVIVYLPGSSVLFTSDLVYVDSVGFMGEGFMQDWIRTLEFMNGIEANIIVPGSGPVAGREELVAFRDFFRAFMTKVIRHIEKGDSLRQTLKTFSLPEYEKMHGYSHFLKNNLERAYQQLQETLGE